MLNKWGREMYICMSFDIFECGCFCFSLVWILEKLIWVRERNNFKYEVYDIF